MLGSLRTTTSFSSEDAFPSVILSAKILKHFMSDCDSQENENSYVQQTKLNKTDNDLDS